MLRQEAHLQHRGLIKVGSQFPSSPGIIKHPKPLVIPAPISEEVNTDKVVNEPDQVGIPVNTEKDVFAEAKPTPEQEEAFKKEKLGDTLDLPQQKNAIKKSYKRRKNPDDLFFDF